MAKEFRKCKIKSCNKEVHANGFCSSHNHYYDKSGHFGGVYKITLDGKIYIGKANMSVNKRMDNEKSALKLYNPNDEKHEKLKKAVAPELLKYFDNVCIKEFGQDNYLNTELRSKIIERMKFEIEVPSFPFCKADGTEWRNEEEMREMSYQFWTKHKANELEPKVEECYQIYVKSIDRDETRTIHKYEDEDIANGTNKLLNLNKRQYSIK